MKSRRRLAAIGLAAALLPAAVWIASVMACGPDFQPEVFVTEHHPDKPQRYVEGQLGIVRNTYYRAELVIAYRYLSGGRLSDAEKTAYEPAALESDQPYAWDEQRQKDGEAAVNSWETARNGVPGSGNTPATSENKTVEVKLGDYRESGTELNCTDGAFTTAAKTLQARAKAWGLDSDELREWVHGQDAVFANCQTPQTLPDAAKPEWKPLLRQDRTYQIAAAEFYAGKYDDAVRDFEAIGKDKSSPWSRWGEYLAARAQIRRAASNGRSADFGDKATFDLDGLREAQTRLQKIESESRDPEIQHAAIEEEHFIEVRLQPSKRLDDAAAALAGPAPDKDFANDFTDLDILIESTPAQADLAQWIQRMQATGPVTPKPIVPKPQVLEVWKQKRTTPWMVAAILLTPFAEADELMPEAAKLKPDAPGYDTVNFYRIQWMLWKGQTAEARSLSTTMLAGLDPEASESERNALLGARMPTARNLAEFLADAPRTMVEPESSAANMAQCSLGPPNPTGGCSGKIPDLQFDGDAAGYLSTQMPLAMLQQAAVSTYLPKHLRDAVAMVAWVRALGLGDTTSVHRMSKLLPAPLQKTAGDSGFPATLTLLKGSGLRPFLEQGVQRSVSYSELDHYRDNWWCGRWTDGSLPPSQVYYLPKPVVLPPLGFLTNQQRQQAADEAARLNALPPGLIWVGQRAIPYIKAHPTDKDAPETLARIVHGTRYGCGPYGQKSNQTALSKEAFEMLHRMYPKSEWAMKTKYYY